MVGNLESAEEADTSRVVHTSIRSGVRGLNIASATTQRRGLLRAQVRRGSVEDKKRHKRLEAQRPEPGEVLRPACHPNLAQQTNV